MTRGAAITLTVVRSLVPLFVFVAFAAWMVHDWRRDPYDPALTGTAAYGHNGEGALGTGLGLCAGELLAFYLLTCPFLVRRPRWFFVIPLVGLGALAAWTLLFMVLSMHAGGIIMIHFLWLLVLGALMLVETVISAVSGLLAGRARAEPVAGA